MFEACLPSTVKPFFPIDNPLITNSKLGELRDQVREIRQRDDERGEKKQGRTGCSHSAKPPLLEPLGHQF